VRLDSGNDAEDNLVVFYQPETYCEFIIKRNLRHESLEGWWELAKKEGKLIQLREGKKVYIGSTYRDYPNKNKIQTFHHNPIYSSSFL
jgi:hypothetical protein